MNLAGKMSARVWALTSVLLFFAIALISIIPLFAAHTAAVTEPLNNTWIKNGTNSTFNFNVTFNTSSVNNITAINVSAPSGFSISAAAPLSTTGGFACTKNASLVNCTNATGPGLGNGTLSLIIQVNATPQTTTATYTWVVNTTDSVLATNSYATIVKVDADAPAVAAPTVNLSSLTTKLNTNFFINTSYNDGSGSGISACSYNVTNSTGGFAVPWTAMNYSTGVVGVANATINSTLPDGANSIYVNCTDLVGWTGYSSATVLTVDTRAPTCSAFVSNDSFARNGDLINFTATCTDTGGSGIASVYLNLTSVNASAIVQATSSGANAYSAVIRANSTDGIKVVYVLNVTDVAGNTNSSLAPNATFVLDSTNPQVVANPTRYPGVQTWAKGGNTITLNASVNASPAGVYSVTVNGSQINASESITLAYDGANYVNSTVTVGSVASGQKNLTVTAIDNSSNVNNSVTLTVLVDNTNPVVSAFTVNRSTVRTNWTVFFTAVVNDANSGINASSVFVRNSSGATTPLLSTDGANFNGSVPVLESEGTYLYNLTVSDNVSNTATQSLTIIVDNTAPLVTARSTVYPVNQTAAKLAQYVNVNVTIDASISGLLSATVNASSLGLAASIPLVQQGSSNNYNATLLVNTSISNATLYLPVTAIDNSSNVNASVSLTVIVDNANPTVTAQNTRYPGVQTWAKTGQTITLNASVADVGSGVYSVAVDGSTIGASGSIPLLFDGTNYVNATVVIGTSTTGTKNLTVTATDNASNVNNTISLTVLVDNTNPVVQFTANATAIRTNASVNFTAVITDVGSGVNASSVFVSNSSGVQTQLSLVAVNTFYAPVTIRESADGTYQYNLTVLDNVTNANATQSLTIIVDNTNPTVTARQTAYPSGQTYAKSGDSITLNATVADATSGLASVTVNASALGLSSSLTLSGAGTEKTAAVSVNTTNNGTVTLLVTAIDNSGNVNSTISLSVNIDSTNPSVTANSPTYPGIQTWVKNGQNITLNATVTDSTAGVKTVTVNASAIGGSAVLALVKDGSSDNYNNTLTVSGVTLDGTKSLLVTATDNANNINNTVSLSVKVDATAPAVTITAPANAANVSGTYLITLTVNDTSSGVNVSSIALYINNAAQAKACTDLGTFVNCSFSWNTAGGADGTYIINATALDNATNPGVSTQTTVTVDNSAPSLAVTKPIAGQSITDTLEINATVSDGRLNASSCKYKVTNATGTIVDWTSLSYSGGYCTGSADAKSFPVGAQTVFVNVSDVLGNLNSTNVSISSAAGIWVNSVTATKSSAYTTGSDYLEYSFNVTLKGGARVKLKLSPLTDGTHAYAPEGQATITSNSSTYSVQQNYTDSAAIVPVSGLFTLRYNVPSGMVAGTYTASYGVGLYS